MRFSYCYDNDAKDREKRKQAKFLRAATKMLPGFKVEFKFNPGGIAVWGETFVKVFRATDSQPVVEACISKDHSYIRQWAGGSASGRNITLNQNAEEFAKHVERLASQPFVRF